MVGRMLNCLQWVGVSGLNAPDSLISEPPDEHRLQPTPMGLVAGWPHRQADCDSTEQSSKQLWLALNAIYFFRSALKSAHTQNSADHLSNSSN